MKRATVTATLCAVGLFGLDGCQLIEGISSKDYEPGATGGSDGAGAAAGGSAQAGGASGIGGAAAAGHPTGGTGHGGTGGANASGHGGAAGQGGTSNGGAAGSGAGGVSGSGGSAGKSGSAGTGGAVGPGGGGSGGTTTGAGGAQGGGGDAQGGQAGSQGGQAGSQGGQAGSQGGQSGTGGTMGLDCVPPPSSVDCSIRSTGVALQVPGTVTTISNSVGIVPALVTNGAVIAWTEASGLGATYNMNAATLSNPAPMNIATLPAWPLAAGTDDIIWSDGKYIQRQTWNGLFLGSLPIQNVQGVDNGLTSTVALFLDDKGFGAEPAETELAVTKSEKCRIALPGVAMDDVLPTPWNDFADVFQIARYPDGTFLLAGSKQGIVFFDDQGALTGPAHAPAAGRCFGALATDVQGLVYVVEQDCGTPGDPLLHVYASSNAAGSDAGPFTLQSCQTTALLPTHMTLSNTHLYFTIAASGAIGRVSRQSLKNGGGTVTPEGVLLDDAGCPGAPKVPTGPDQLAVSNGVLVWSNTESKHLTAVAGLQ